MNEDCTSCRQDSVDVCGAKHCRCRCHAQERDQELARAIVAAHLGTDVIREAVDAGFRASFRTRTIPTRASVRMIALAWLGERIDSEIARRVLAVEREAEKKGGGS
jgi:hypothetical protein